MTECAAHLVDEVLPRVPVRQWVLSLPYRLRYLWRWITRGITLPTMNTELRALEDR